MRVFVTGASGFLGRALCRRLLQLGHEVTGSARGARPPELRAAGWLRADLATDEGLARAREAAAAADAVSHLAAVRKAWGLPPERLRRVNVESAAELRAAAPSARRFLFASSAAVYGPLGPDTVDESSPTVPRGRYGRSKLAAELALAAEAGKGPQLVVVRPGLVYGPGDDYGMVTRLARLLDRGRFLRVGAGTARVRPLYIDDLTEGLAAALTVPLSERWTLLVLGGPADVPVRELVGGLSAALGRRPPPPVPEAAARAAAALLTATHRLLRLRAEPFLTREKVDLFTRDQRLDSSAARQTLGFAPKVELAAGLGPTVEWLRASGALR